MDYQLVVLPNAFISKTYNKGYKYTFENYNINYRIGNIKDQIHILNNFNNILDPLFVDTNVNHFAISKFYRYDTDAGIKPYFCLDLKGRYVKLHFEERSDNLLLFYLVKEAICKHGINIEKDKCCLCGNIMSEFEKQHNTWQYCTNCWNGKKYD